MALVDKLYIASVWTDSSVRANNLTGTPLVSAEKNDTGEAISDEYTLTISARAGSTGTVTVSASANNPFSGRVVTGVEMDDTTPVTNIIPGVSIIFDNAAANGNTASIIVGDPYGSFDATGVDAGVPTAGVRHQVENDGDADVSDAKAMLLPMAFLYKKTGSVLEYVRRFAEGAEEKIAGSGSSRVMPYGLTISDVAGSGSGKTCTLSIDGGAFGTDSILDLISGTTQNGTLLKAVGSDNPYKVVDGPLTGLEFAIHPSCANTNTCNVLIFESRYVQIAPDVAGVEGTYGVDDVILTTTGEVDGVILSGDVAYYWTRFLVPEAANNESNPYPTSIALRASQSTAAGWGA